LPGHHSLSARWYDNVCHLPSYQPNIRTITERGMVLGFR
jgi:hypothetical protein